MMMIVAGMWAGNTRDSGAAMELCGGVHLAFVHRAENPSLSSHHSTKMCATKNKGNYHLQLEFNLILLQDSLMVRHLNSLPTSFQLEISDNTSLIQPILGINIIIYHQYLSFKSSRGRNLDLWKGKIFEHKCFQLFAI